MQWTGLNELREKYLSFFESKGHLRLPSFSLVPEGDKSILLINAGMTPMKKYFTGEATPPRTRVTTCQKCIRTPDIENVGKTARHGTFFEMLGNFSFGDYFKREATSWAWEFFTKTLEMPEDKLYVSVYQDDDEAFDIWTKEVGVDPSHMVRFGKEDNFWEHGAGPCGPCSEIYFDRGPEKGCGKPACKVGCDCDRYVEVWNLVFTQFENDGNGNYTKLSHPNIDTGMGLERLACVMQGVDNLFEVDTIRNIMTRIMNIASLKYHEDPKKDVSLRVITDHIRSCVFMVGDGVLPSNSGRGYVLRRLLRRASRHGRLLGIESSFLSDVADTVISENETAYPNLLERKDYIKKVISMEEESFSKTIDSGLNLLNDMIKKTEGDVLSGDDAFKLSDTYGFPIDLTKEILFENNMTLDEERSSELIKEARQKAKNVKRDALETDWRNSGSFLKDIEKTEFTGYSENGTLSKVAAVIIGSERAYSLKDGEEGSVVLYKTPFYARSGGQVGDTGEIRTGEGKFIVTDVIKNPDGVIIHKGKFISDVSGAELSEGSPVAAVYDEDRRRDIMRNHTAAHILQAALRKVLGSHVEQAGQLVDDKNVRFDFTHFAPLTSSEIKEIENLVNAEIMNAQSVDTAQMTLEEAKKTGAMALFGEKYGDIVRVVSVGDFSKELCGGTHVKNTGELGLFKIISEQSASAGVRRIEGVTGRNALNYINEREKILSEASYRLKLSNISDLPKKAESLSLELKKKEKEIERLRQNLSDASIKSLLADALDVNGIKIIIKRTEDGGKPKVDDILDSAKKLGADIIMVAASVLPEKNTVAFGSVCGKDAIEKGADAGKIVKEAALFAGGNGGGKPDRALAGGKNIEKTDGALEKACEAAKLMILGK